MGYKTIWEREAVDFLKVGVMAEGLLWRYRIRNAFDILNLPEGKMRKWDGCGKKTASEVMNAIRDEVAAGTFDMEFALHGEILNDAHS